MKEFNLQEDFSVSVSQFFDLFFLSPKFKLDFHVARGDTDISVGDWKELGSNKHERAIKFSSQVSDQAILRKLTGGISPVVYEKQDYEFVDKELHVASLATSSAGGFNCATTTSYIITENQKINTPYNGACHVDIVVRSEFKSRLFKGQVENMMNHVASQTFEQWLALVKSKIIEFNKEKQQHTLKPIQSISSVPEYIMDTLSTTPSTTESEYDTDDDNYYDAPDHPFTSPPVSRTHTPIPHTDHSTPHISHTSATGSVHSGSNTFPPTVGMASLVHHIQKELQQVKSMTEVNSSRLLGLEASKHSAPSQANLFQNEGLLPYLQRLDALVEQQEQEAQRNREKEQAWQHKLEEMEAKLGGMNGKGKFELSSGAWLGVFVFLLAWPVVAHKLWKYSKIFQPVIEKMFWRIFGK